MEKASRHALAAEAARCLQDARNEELSLHTRYSAACSAVIACHLAGLASDAEVAFAMEWETKRYEPGVKLSELELDAVIALVERLLK